jgi:hypothetical protein
VRARDVPREAVADHDRILGWNVERRERCLEDARIGFSESDLGRDDRDIERRRERRMGELLALHVGRAVGHQREAMVARQIAHHRFGLGVDELDPAARGAEGLHRLVDELVIGDSRRGQGAAPDAAAEVGDERPQVPEPSGVAQELAPQGLSLPDPHRVRVLES